MSCPVLFLFPADDLDGRLVVIVILNFSRRKTIYHRIIRAITFCLFVSLFLTKIEVFQPIFRIVLLLILILSILVLLILAILILILTILSLTISLSIRVRIKFITIFIYEPRETNVS